LEERMYAENRKSLNAFVGCRHGCVYCVPSFQRQMKRTKCESCRAYKPHGHLERLKRNPPKTSGNEFIFFPSSGDLAFASREVVEAHIFYAREHADRTFLVQSKDTSWFPRWKWPDNIILGTTLETDRISFDTPSKYKFYYEISEAPLPAERVYWLERTPHSRKAITVEPVMQFTGKGMSEWIRRIKPEFVYVGYDNHGCRLPEPLLGETVDLIVDLRGWGFEVREKTLREAWYE